MTEKDITWIPRFDAINKLNDLFVSERNKLSSTFQSRFNMPWWPRMRNYELEMELEQWFGGRWSIDEPCPMNGIFCSYADKLQSMGVLNDYDLEGMTKEDYETHISFKVEAQRERGDGLRIEYCDGLWKPKPPKVMDAITQNRRETEEFITKMSLPPGPQGPNPPDLRAYRVVRKPR